MSSFLQRDNAATAASHGLCTEGRPPVRRPFLQQGVADVRARLLIELFENVEAELLYAILPPGCLEVRVRMAALPQREPDAVLDGGKVRPLPHPDLAGRRAADRVYAADHLALLISGDGRLSVFCHRVPVCLRFEVPARTPCWSTYYYPGNICTSILSG